ncbi:MAG TPA: hypothetical protein VN704_04770 [Verrucomicrobiae bacterium]|nr:hypothetical protein [Verrucomicrobiae bacterium]
MPEKFVLIEIEKQESKKFCDYKSLDMDRDVEFRVYENTEDQYGNKRSRELLRTPNLIYAKKFLRSCRLTHGIIIEDV